jgi:5S rRNA maturation endonuclease (ribonuclease M5)
MLTAVQDAVNLLLPAKRKTNSISGWISFNGPCCHETRGRGGIIANSNGSVSYHCFNCNFKANYTPGRHLNYKFRKLLSYLGADDNTIKRLVIEAVRVKDLIAPEELEKVVKEEVQFEPRPLPDSVVSFSEWRTFLSLQAEDEPVHPQFWAATKYILNRKIDVDRYEFYTTDTEAYNLHKRIIIPFYWKGELIGYTARGLDDNIKPKYYSQYATDFVFNVDLQTAEKKFVIVTEGPFDAMAIDGVAILGNDCSEVQADIIDSLGREVIVVPDNDKAGKNLVNQALEYGWSVSFPIWHETCKDINQAVIKYGKLFVLKTILAGKESSRLKIELRKKKMND